jgi:hypothetical protein
MMAFREIENLMPIKEPADKTRIFRTLLKGQASSKQMTVIQPPGVQWVVRLLQLKLAYACDIFTPRVQPQETNFLSISC